MRILHISTRLILGGSQENTVLSCEGQARMGHEVHLAYGPIYGPEGSLKDRVEKFRTVDGRGIHSHEVASLVRQISPFTDYRCYGELRKLIRELRPDVVHTHSSKAGVLGRAAGWVEKKRARVEMERDAKRDKAISGTLTKKKKDPEEFGGYKNLPHPVLRDIPGVGVAESPSAAGAGPGLAGGAIVHTIHGSPFHKYQSNFLHNLYVKSERYAAQRCDMIVSVADAMTKQYLAAGIGRPEQYVTVRSGMEVAPFLSPALGERREQVRARLGLSERDFVIGTVSRLAELKGHDDLLDALAENLKANPNWKLLWVGDGWWREKLLAKARGLGLTVAELDKQAERAAKPAGQIVVTGLMAQDQVPGLTRAMDVLAHPSYREGLPRTVPQALLCGVCPVAYEVDGTGEVCREGETGKLVAPGDLAGLKAAIEWCASHPIERRALADKGRVECAVEFSAKKMVEDLERVYETAMAIAR
jgi:glycosyltransferase involved in cell wall biosynthesis